jgi:hypothetical protein
MRQLLFVAVRTLRERQSVQVIVRAPIACAPLRMSSLRIRHYSSSWQAATQSGLNGKDYCSVLLLFEPVLLQTGERGKPGIRGMLIAAALFVI